MPLKRRFVGWGLAGLLAIVAGYWYWSPHLAVYQTARAADLGDAAAFDEHVDYPALRESVKAEMAARWSGKMARIGGSASHNPIAEAGAALGALLGPPVVDASVDAMVKPDVVMYAMRHDGHLDPAAASAQERSHSAGSAADANRRQVGYAIERKDSSTVLVYPGEHSVASAKADKKPALVFDRHGFASWKLAGLRLPPDE